MGRDGFIGRERELEHLLSWLRSAAADRRLLTIVGPGGVGKTRLVREALAHPVLGDASTRLIDLSRASELPTLCTTVAAQVGIELDPANSDPAGQLADALAARGAGHGPLALDNLEQLVDEAAPALARWLDAAPELRLLVTSRQRLRVAGEQTLELAPLSCDDDAEAVRLFRTRARELHGERAADVPAEQARRLVETLDGLPLAIELAVSRLGVLSVDELAQSLARPFAMLRGGYREAPERHRTMATAIAWSWQQLGAAERTTLGHCATFEGAFDWRMASELLGETLDEDQVVGALEALVDRSLLQRHEGPARGQPPRFRMLVLIQRFARDQLGPQLDELLRRHAETFGRKLGPVVAPRWDGSQADHFDWLEAARDDLLAAHRRCCGELERPELALRFAVGLGPLLDRRGALPHYLQLLDDALAASARERNETAPPALIAAGLNGRGFVKRRQGDLTGARADLEAALGLLAGADDEPAARLSVSVLGNLGSLASLQGDMPTALERFTHAAERAADLGDESQQAVIEACAARVRYIQGECEEARAISARCLMIHQRLGDRRAEARALARLGFMAQDQGELEEARRTYEQALAIAEREQLAGHEGIALLYLGNLARREGDQQAAEQRYRQAIATLRRAGHREFHGVAWMDLGICLLLAGEPDRAERAFGRASEALAGLASHRCRALSESYLGVLAARRGDSALAARRQAEAEAAVPAVADRFHGAIRLNREHLALAAASKLAPGPQREAMLAEIAAAIERAEASPTEHVVLAARLLRRALARVAPPEGAMVLARDGGSLRDEQGARVDITRHEAPRRLLAALIDAWLCGPRSLDREALIRAGWPDERLQRPAALNRLRVALSTLRRLGLAESIEHHLGGYRLRPDAPLVIDDAVTDTDDTTNPASS